MYKARLSQWGFTKNSSDRDYQVCAVLHHTRRERGKRATAFLIHGNKRSFKDLLKYIKGRKMTEDEFLTTALQNVSVDGDPQAHAHIRAFTPSPEPEAGTEAEPELEEPEVSESGGQQGEREREREREYDQQQEESQPAAKTSSSSTLSISPPESVSWPWSNHRYSARSPHEKTRALSPPQRVSHQLSDRSPQPHDGLNTAHSPRSHFPPKASYLAHVTRRPSRGTSNSTTTTTATTTTATTTTTTTTTTLRSVTSAPTGGQVRYAHPWPPAFSSAAPDLHIDGPPEQAQDDSQASPMVCHYLDGEVETMAQQMVNGGSLKSIYGADDVYGWRLMESSTSSPDSQDFEMICPKCHKSTSSHFISLGNLELPGQPRGLFHETTAVAENTLTVPPSVKEHDHSWKWVARCFLACIYFRRGNEEYSGRSLQDADVEFEQMLNAQDPKVLMAVNHTMSILHMHNQNEISKSIIASAYRVARRVLGPDDPVTVTVRWMTYVADLTMRDRDITSSTLRQIHQILVSQHGERDPRSIASLYNYGYMLNVERHLREAEIVLRQVYQISSSVLGEHHMQSISALINLHRCLDRQGRVEEAIQTLRKAINDSRDTLGRRHPRRLESKRLLALLYEKQGRLDRTEKLYWQVLEGRVKMLGRTHEFTLGMKRDLEALLRKLGKWGGEHGEAESAEQIKIHDIFEWDAEERWNGSDSDTGSQHEAF